MKFPGMIDPLLILVAILPGLLICWYIYQLDKYEKESRIHLIVAFALGLLATFPIIRMEEWLSELIDRFRETEHWSKTLITSFLLTGVVEETIKFLILLLYAYPRSFFDEPLDGIVYATMIAMGFATLENIFYALHYGLGTTILRAFTAVPAHGVFAVVVGYYAGRAKFGLANPRRVLLKGLLAAILAHGIYDFLIFQKIYEGLVVLAIVFVWLAIYFERDLIKDHQRHSPFRKRK